MKKIFSCLIILALCLVMIFSAVGCDNEKPTPEQPAEQPTEKAGSAVTSANKLASEVGQAVLQNGGNAFDAVVAMAFAIGVVEPNASGIGGGGVMVGYDVDDGYVFYNFREFAPEKATAEEIGDKESLTTGKKASGVPTEVLGLLKILENLGSGAYTREQIIQPAVDLAENGFVIDARTSQNIRDYYFKFMYEQEQNIYGNGLTGLKPGATLKNQNYANVLKEIQQKGADGFYKGWVADAIVRSTRLIKQSDLDYAVANYPKISTPLSGTYNGYDIYTSNIPSTGGIVLLETLNMIESYCKANNISLQSLGHNSAEYVHLVGTATQLAYADKRHYVGDTSFVQVPVQGLISKDYATARFAGFTTTDTIRLPQGSDYGGACGVDPWDYQQGQKTTYNATVDIKDEGTTSFSAVDQYGNVATITQTINSYWGSQVMPEGTGMFLNNQLADFTLDEESVNVIEPFKQPLSSMAPTIVMKDGKPVMTVGCPGSTTIPTALIQVVLNRLEFGMTMQQAVDSARFQNECVSEADSITMGDAGDITTLKLIKVEDTETQKFEESVLTALGGKNYYVSRLSMITHVYGIGFNYDADGKLTLDGGADTRRDGVALVFEVEVKK